MKQPVLFPAVAGPACGHHVLPAVGASTAAGNHMIDALRGASAVLASVAVTQEHRSAIQRHPGLERDIHVVIEPDDGWLGECEALGSEDADTLLKELGLLGEDEREGPTGGYNRQRLEAGIQNERAGHISLYVS